jgi:hypothetical protein
VVDKSGNTKTFKMPKESYMKMEPGYGHLAWLLISPWDFAGMGGLPGEEYWVLGAQFLQNYYSIYNFDKNEIGLVESISSLVE